MKITHLSKFHKDWWLIQKINFNDVFFSILSSSDLKVVSIASSCIFGKASARIWFTRRPQMLFSAIYAFDDPDSRGLPKFFIHSWTHPKVLHFSTSENEDSSVNEYLIILCTMILLFTTRALSWAWIENYVSRIAFILVVTLSDQFHAIQMVPMVLVESRAPFYVTMLHLDFFPSLHIIYLRYSCPASFQLTFIYLTTLGINV